MAKLNDKSEALLRKLPKVDQVLAHPAAVKFLNDISRTLFADMVRDVIEDLRRQARDGEVDSAALAIEAVVEAAKKRTAARRAPALCRAVNATGVILHTGLGRAVLPPEAVQAIAREQSGYSLLEVERATGERSIREVHVAALLRELTGAEAATVVNNNAAATMLALHALAKDRQVITSRGQLVEIGGSFRIPEVMESSGAKLVEVGTTNKTYASDYERAITPNTALLLRVHTSNYRIVGFVADVSIEELVALGKKHSLPVMDDLGSGAMIDLSQVGLGGEPTVQASVKAGADVICFSGDKLLGGPQAGIIVGKKDVIGRIRKDPLFRALRVDKLTLTALEVTLRLYLEPEKLAERLPIYGMLTLPPDELERRALDLATRLQKVPGLNVSIQRTTSEVGGGSLPAQSLPTQAVAVIHSLMGPDALAARLRVHTPPVFARIHEDRLLLDVRTLRPGDADDVERAFLALSRP